MRGGGWLHASHVQRCYGRLSDSRAHRCPRMVPCLQQVIAEEALLFLIDPVGVENVLPARGACHDEGHGCRGRKWRKRDGIEPSSAC